MNTAQLLQQMRQMMAPFSPRRYRWQRFLRNLPLDPHALPRPLPAPAPNDFIICGSPRTGTTLLCALLFQPPQVVTVMEPWDGMRLAPADLFASLRTEIATTGMLQRGKLDVETLMSSGRVQWQQEGETAVPIPIQPDYLLGVKWPAFWQYLELLPSTKFLVCVRHPLETIASYKKTGGRLEQGLEYEIKFNQELNEGLELATADLALRRIKLYDYVNSGLLPHLSRPNVFVVRYERWFTEPDMLLSEMSDFLGTPLDSGFAKIQPPGHLPKANLSSTELRLIKEQCQTAPELGYSLDEYPMYELSTSE